MCNSFLGSISLLLLISRMFMNFEKFPIFVYVPWYNILSANLVILKTIYECILLFYVILASTCRGFARDNIWNALLTLGIYRYFLLWKIMKVTWSFEIENQVQNSTGSSVGHLRNSHISVPHQLLLNSVHKSY